MSLRWYTVVVDCHDVKAQSRWWADVLGWHIAYEADDEVVIAPPHQLDASREIPHAERGPGLIQRPWRTRIRHRTRGATSQAPLLSQESPAET